MTIIDSDLDWLERRGHRVDRVATMVHGRPVYYIDGVACTAEQIIRYMIEQVPMGFKVESPSEKHDTLATC